MYDGSHIWNQWGMEELCRTNEIIIWKKFWFLVYIKLHFSCIKDLHIENKIIKVLEKTYINI